VKAPGDPTPLNLSSDFLVSKFAFKFDLCRYTTVTNLLALEGCIDTIIGDDLVRGVSGGEKKRVTIAETLVTNARLLCMVGLLKLYKLNAVVSTTALSSELIGSDTTQTLSLKAPGFNP
jgi:hypothetical protein